MVFEDTICTLPNTYVQQFQLFLAISVPVHPWQKQKKVLFVLTLF